MCNTCVRFIPKLKPTWSEFLFILNQLWGQNILAFFYNILMIAVLKTIERCHYHFRRGRLDVKIMIKKCNYVIMFRNFNVDLIWVYLKQEVKRENMTEVFSKPMISTSSCSQVVVEAIYTFNWEKRKSKLCTPLWHNFLSD